MQLRLELSKASLLAMIGEVEETPIASEDLPPGMDDLVDPAKVCLYLPPAWETHFQRHVLQGLEGACLFSISRKALFRCEEVSLCQQPGQ